MSEQILKENKTTSRSRSYYVHSIVCVAIMLGFDLIPPFAGISEVGMRVLGIFLGSIYGWVCVEFIWPSLLAMVLLGLSGYTSITEVFGMGFGDSIILMTFLTFVLFNYIERSGLMAWMANWFISLKINVGRPWVLTFIIFFASAIIGALTNPNAVIIMFWFIFYGICNEVGYKKGDKYLSFMIGGIVFFATISLTIFPFTPYLQVMVGIVKSVVHDPTVTTGAWLIMEPLLIIIMIFVYMIFGKFLYKVDVTPLVGDDHDRFAHLRHQKMNKAQKIGALYLIIFVLILILPTILPKTWALTMILSNLSTIGASTVCLAAIGFSRDEEGKRITHFGDLVSKGVNWDMILLLVATVPICGAMESADTGIIAALVGGITPFLHMIAISAIFIVGVIICFGLLTQVAHNLILLLVFLPVLTQFSLGFGIHPFLFALLFNLMLQSPNGTPGGCAQAAMFFGNTKWIDTKECYKLGLSFMAIAMAVLLIVGIPVGSLLFNIMP